MSERLNKTSICSIVFLDIVEYSRKPVSEQIECKEHFNRLISDAIEDVAQNDRILLDTGDGAALAFLGAPEEALFVSLTIRDNILKGNQERSTAHLFVRMGINLGPVRVVKDINSQLSIIGDGINVAQRVMSFAEPNQILVSRSYYEIVSRLSDEFTQMFTYSGVKQDKHVREHEVYIIRPSSEHGAPVHAESDDNTLLNTRAGVSNSRPKKFAVAGILLALLAGTALLLSRPAKQPMTKVEKTTPLATANPASETKVKSVSVKSPVQIPEKPSEPLETSTEKNKKPAQKAKTSAPATHKPQSHVAAESHQLEQAKSDNSKSSQHTHPEQGASPAAECNVVQRSLNQCR